MAWTKFWDMHGGGTLKGDFQYYYINEKQDKAAIVFYNKFGIDPYRTTCYCCGEDYAVSEHKTLTSATGYHRGCEWSQVKKDYVNKPDPKANYISLKKYKEQKDVLIIYKKDITREDTKGEPLLPKDNY